MSDQKNWTSTNAGLGLGSGTPLKQTLYVGVALQCANHLIDLIDADVITLAEARTFLGLDSTVTPESK